MNFLPFYLKSDNASVKFRQLTTGTLKQAVYLTVVESRQHCALFVDELPIAYRSNGTITWPSNFWTVLFYLTIGNYGRNDFTPETNQKLKQWVKTKKKSITFTKNIMTSVFCEVKGILSIDYPWKNDEISRWYLLD